MTYRPVEEKSLHGGIQRIYRFENSRYGASVVCHEGSYSRKGSKWELAVLYDDELCYDTHITNDVRGWLNDDDVQNILAQIDRLRDPK